MNEYEIVPIGVDCTPTHRLRNAGVRVSAFPFDWNITPLASAVTMLYRGFDEFLDIDNLVFLDPVPRMLFNEEGDDLIVSNQIITPVVCMKYKMLFPHDFSSRGVDDYPVVRDKYRRRIERLELIMEKGGEIIFVNAKNDLNPWQEKQFELAGLDTDEVVNSVVNEREINALKGFHNFRFEDINEFETRLG